MGKTSKTANGARKRTPKHAATKALVIDSLLKAKRDLQRANRIEREIHGLAKQLGRRIRSRDAALLELGAGLLDRASKLAKQRGERQPDQHPAESIAAAGVAPGV